MSPPLPVRSRPEAPRFVAAPIEPDPTGPRPAGPLGRRFRLFPQPPHVRGYERPETVFLPDRFGPVGAGPSDGGIRTVAPSEAKRPYEYPFLPPFDGPAEAGAEPDADGHFDHLEPDDPRFAAVHAYAGTRWALASVEAYRGPVRWFFAPERGRLELVARLRGWNNAQAGFGFIELGEERAEDGAAPMPFALNLDIIAHELGHLALFDAMGSNRDVMRAGDVAAFHEAAGDIVAMVSLLRFERALDHLLRRSGGNLMVANELDRIGEMAGERQIRRASNRVRMADVGTIPHDRALPLIGALFDAIVEVSEALGLEAGVDGLDPARVPDPRRQLRPERLDALLHPRRADPETEAAVHATRRDALARARDVVARAFFAAWDDLRGPFTMADAARAILAHAPWDERPDLAVLIEASLAWRGLVR